MNCHFRIVRIFVFQAEDGIRGLVRSRGLGDVYKRQLGKRANDVEELAAWDGHVAWFLQVDCR